VPSTLLKPEGFEEDPMTEVLAAIAIQVVSALLIALIAAAARRVFGAAV
jgi:hypothetical protein